MIESHVEFLRNRLKDVIQQHKNWTPEEIESVTDELMRMRRDIQSIQQNLKMYPNGCNQPIKVNQ
jgi:hypothetical protein